MTANPSMAAGHVALARSQRVWGEWGRIEPSRLPDVVLPARLNAAGCAMRDDPQKNSNWNRREVLRQGLIGSLGLNLGSLIWARAALAEQAASTPGALSKRPMRAGESREGILAFYYGGPSHLDSYDLKPNAPKEIRGEFDSISTSV